LSAPLAKQNAAPDHRYDYSQAACGGLEIALASTRVVLRPSGALWLADEAALVIADLHLEKGSAYASRGQMLPPYDSRDGLARLTAEVGAVAPRLIVFLGDAFHDNDGEARLVDADHAAVEAIARNRRLVWIVGNHDPEAPRTLPGESAPSLRLQGLDLVHEPSEADAWPQVAGHLHPCAKVKGRVASVRRRCFVTDGERLILPAFGAYAGGLNVLDGAFAGLFRRMPLAAALGAGRVHPVGWRALRPD
jgi:DNA ligase-associated metallophosphoesterase